MDDIGTHPNYDAHDGGAVPIPIIDVRTATVKYPARALSFRSPAEPPDADALRALHNAGAHLLLAAHNKVPFNKAWEQQPADIDAVIAHRRRGGAGQGGAHAQGRKGTPERGQGVGARSSINTTSSARVEARRESPGSPMESLDTYAAANLLSMRPGANAGINRSGNSNLAPDCGLASMRPGANRRDHE